MSKYHGEQYWTDIHHQTIRDWRDLNDDDFDTLHAMRHEREVRAREYRTRVRRYRRSDIPDLEL